MNSAEMAARIKKLEEQLHFTMGFIKVIKQTRSLLMPEQVINEEMGLLDLWRQMKVQDAMLIQSNPVIDIEDPITDEVTTDATV